MNLSLEEDIVQYSRQSEGDVRQAQGQARVGGHRRRHGGCTR